MIKVFGYSIFIGLSFILSACQSTQHFVDASRIKDAEKKQFSQNNVQIYCSGAENCEFDRMNNIKIVDQNSHRVNSKAIKKGYVKLTGDALDKNGLYLTIPAQQYEIVIRFYPISQQHAEVFHVIHQFKPNQRYTFKMYRKRSQSSGSLLNVSAPTPLCVDLIQEKRTIRRFCRPYDVVTGVSEYVEQKI